ncbi:hypothetical protein MVEG_10216 [Podila verticillata NRRL 6337]|nr:hypothetical protein MVEG_10216 [Podila verticillata NRRL 6337]
MLSTENSSTNLPDTTPSPPTPQEEPAPVKQLQEQEQEKDQEQEQPPPPQDHPQLEPPQPGQNKQARPVSEIFPNHVPLNGKSFQSPEAEAIDKWFEDLSHYEQTLEEMAVVSLDHVFKEELSTIESWFSVLSEAERTAALYSLLQHSSQVQIRFFITVLQQLAKKDPVGALLSPTVGEKDPAQTQLHGALVKAEKEVSQRLLSVLPIQPPTTPLDRPTVGRRLYDRHSMTMGESEEYSRLFRRDNKRNSTDILGLHLSSQANAHANTSGLGNGSHINTPNTNTTNTNNNVNNAKVNGASTGPIGSGSGVFSESSARVNHYKLPQALSSSNRVSAPGLFANRPKSVCEGDASSIFSSNWNFASLGGTPLTNGPSTTSSGLSGSPGNIGDRTSLGRPKSVGGAEWILNTTTTTNNRPQPGAEGVENTWTPLLMSPTMGGFHGGSNGTGHSFAGSSSGYSGSSLAVERPKSVTEADLAKLNISQWSLNGPNTNLLGSRSDDPMKPNRRRTLLRPSAIISNVPVTVLEGDEKLLIPKRCP